MRLIQTGIAVTLLLSACKEAAPTSQSQFQQSSPGITKVALEDSEMNAAKEEARKTLDTFVKAFESGSHGEGLLKVYFTEAGGPAEGEHMWVRPTQLSAAPFKGVLLSTPRWINSVESGAEVTFTRADVTDWLLVNDGKAIGAYTVQVIRKRMSAEERKAHDSGYPFAFE